MERHEKCLLNDTGWTRHHPVYGVLIAHNPKVLAPRAEQSVPSRSGPVTVPDMAVTHRH
jgi:hypothetical protein